MRKQFWHRLSLRLIISNHLVLKTLIIGLVLATFQRASIPHRCPMQITAPFCKFFGKSIFNSVDWATLYQDSCSRTVGPRTSPRWNGRREEMMCHLPPVVQALYRNTGWLCLGIPQPLISSWGQLGTLRASLTRLKTGTKSSISTWPTTQTTTCFRIQPKYFLWIDSLKLKTSRTGPTRNYY